MAVENWNTNESLNGTIEGEDIGEGTMVIPTTNNWARKICAAIRVFYDKSYRKNETIKSTAAGAADPFTTHAEDDIWIEYTP